MRVSNSMVLCRLGPAARCDSFDDIRLPRSVGHNAAFTSVPFQEHGTPTSIGSPYYVLPPTISAVLSGSVESLQPSDGTHVYGHAVSAIKQWSNINGEQSEYSKGLEKKEE
ncbi:jg26916 [Pararge aegeria aegeria]|uniref:Jg26916 protein n=1 Tax=Pararge aegeria aegeria TaxID=348720 RepID=A0A8S4QFK0_9NEOP|nr:jg26916 [Pararge aegeria aegeria]